MLDEVRSTGALTRADNQPRGRLGARLSYWIVVALATCALAPLTFLAARERVAIQNLLFDEYQRLHPRQYVEPPPIRVVEVDDVSLQKLGRWPWPRVRLAELIEKLTSAGAAVVALDVLLYDPGEADDDARLVEALRGRPVVLGEYLTDNGNATNLPDKAGFASAGDDPLPFAYAFRGALPPLPAFAEAAAGVGFLNWLPDNDRVVRRVPLVLNVGGKLAPSFAMEALRVAQGASSYTIKSSNASGETAFGAKTGMVALRNGDAVAAVGPRGDIRIHFPREDPRLRLPAWKALAADADLSDVAGKIIFVGVSAELAYDIVATPLTASAPGVEQHAQLLGQVLAGDRLVRPDWAPGAEFLLTVGLSSLLAVALPFLTTALAAALGAAVTAASFAGSWIAYAQLGLLLDPVMPSLTAGAVFVCGVLSLYSRKRGEEREIRTAFGRYVSPTVVSRLAADPSVLRLGGEERQLTMMFCDLRSFTSLSEGKSASELTHFLNAYLTPMTDIVLAENGTVDKYIGDAIMAFWNAPLDDPNHAERAVRAALGMRAALAQLNVGWDREARHRGYAHLPVRFGVGLNTGLACVGNLGSLRRFDYSVIGDEVNVASRLESASKMFGVDIVASQSTRAEAAEFAWLEVDAVVFKNKTRPVGVHALIGDKAYAASPAFAALSGAHARMMELYRSRAFDEAMEIARELARTAPEPARGLYGFHMRKFGALDARELAEDWRAVTVLEDK